MAFSFLNQSINPSFNQQSSSFFSYLSGLKVIAPYFSAPIKNNPLEKPEDACFNYGMFAFEKEARTSKRTKKLKPKETYVAVVDPVPLGSGSYGGVYPIVGVWRFRDNKWSFKSKAPDKTRLVKTNFFFHESQSLFSSKKTYAKDAQKTYVNEQRVGQYVSHMGYTYPPYTHEEYSFLLLRKQKGQNFQVFLDSLEQDPFQITIVERLQICINLLDALEQQLTKVHPPDYSPETYIVHRDLRPENIILGDDLSVRYIDYGLAVLSCENPEPQGNLLFCDPQLFANRKLQPNSTSDFASVGRIIAKFFGDTSGSYLRDGWDLELRNRQNRLSNLFENIPGLSINDKRSLKGIITQMISYHQEDRPSLARAKEIFKLLHKLRLEYEERENKKNLRIGSLLRLNKCQLLSLFRSPYASAFMERYKKPMFSIGTHHKNKPNYLDYLKDLVEKLDTDILKIPEKILMKLYNFGLNLSSITLSHKLIEDKKLSAAQIALLIRLGVSVDPGLLNNWLHIETKTVRWAEICRLLYHYTNKPEREKVLANWSQVENFSSIFCARFLINPQTAANDKENLRLIERHLQIRGLTKFEFRMIESSLQLLGSCPLTTAIRTLIEEHLHAPQFQLCVSANVYQTQRHLSKLNVAIAAFNSLTIFEGSPIRQQTLDQLAKEITDIKNSSDPEHAFNRLPFIETKLRRIEDIDSYHQKLVKYDPSRHLKTIYQEIDKSYQSNAGLLQATYLKNIGTKITQIEKIRELIAAKKLPSNILMDENYKEYLEKLMPCDLPYVQARLNEYANEFNLLNNMIDKLKQNTQDSRCISRYSFNLKIYRQFIISLKTQNQYQLRAFLKEIDTLTQKELDFKNAFGSHYQAMDAVYETFIDLIERNKLQLSAMDTFFQRVQKHQLIFPELLQQIDRFILNTTHSTQEIRKQFQIELWNYLNLKTYDLINHRAQFINKIKQLTETIQPKTINPHQFYSGQQSQTPDWSALVYHL